MTGEALDLARQAAKAAGLVLKQGLGRAGQIRRKGFRDLVTELDLASQEEIVRRIKEAFPDHVLMAEEDACTTDLSAATWIIDPLDGTTNYVHGLPAYCVSICLVVERRLTVGVIFDPERGELFSAAAGQGAWLNGQTMRTSDTDRLGDALVVTGFPYDVEDHLDTILPQLGRMLTATQGVRRLGSAALDLAYVACGRMDAFWEAGLKPWDLAAGALLVQEAGGVVTDICGGPLDIMSGKILASNGRIHDGLIKIL